MRQKTITLLDSQVTLIQELANAQQEGDFSRTLRLIITSWDDNINKK